MDTNTIMIMGMFITIIIGLTAILKFLFKLNDRITQIEIRIERIESKLEINNKDYVYTNKRIDDANKIVAQIDANYQSLISKIIDKIDSPKTVGN